MEKNIISDKSKTLAEVYGDINMNGIKESVLVYNTSDTTDFGIVREIQILKKEKDNWIIWYKSINAIQSADKPKALNSNCKL